MRGSVFNNVTGKFIAAGDSESPNIAKHIRLGGIFVEGVYGGGPNYLILVNGVPELDTDRISLRDDKNTDDAAKLLVAKQAKADFFTLQNDTTVWTNTEINTAFAKLSLMMSQLIRN